MCCVSCSTNRRLILGFAEAVRVCDHCIGGIDDKLSGGHRQQSQQNPGEALHDNRNGYDHNFGPQ
jgi:hypothetical protein